MCHDFYACSSCYDFHMLVQSQDHKDDIPGSKFDMGSTANYACCRMVHIRIRRDYCIRNVAYILDLLLKYMAGFRTRLHCKLCIVDISE